MTLYAVLEPVFLESGYTIVGVFDSKALADKVAAVCEDSEVMACEINEPSNEWGLQSSRQKVAKVVRDFLAAQNQ